jgi:hypothetical protein
MRSNKLLQILFVIFTILVILTLTACQSEQEYLYDHGCFLTGNQKTDTYPIFVPDGNGDMYPIYTDDTEYEYECSDGVFRWNSGKYDMTKYVPPVYTHEEN